MNTQVEVYYNRTVLEAHLRHSTEIELFYENSVLEILPVADTEVIEIVQEGPQGPRGGGIDGSIATNQVAFGSGANTIAGDDNFQWNGNSLFVGGGSGCRFDIDGYSYLADGNFVVLQDGSVSALSITVSDVFTLVTHFQPETRPSSPVEGDVYQDSTDHHLYHYNGTIWNQLDPEYVLSEVPSGAVDGVNTVFTTANNFSSISVYNGLRQTPGVDFIITAANAITFTSPPTVGSSILVDYLRA